MSNPPGAASGSFNHKLEAASAALGTSFETKGHSFSNNSGNHDLGPLMLPPEITHTAATPQGSPRTAINMDHNLVNSQAFTRTCQHSASMVNIDKTSNSTDDDDREVSYYKS